jgi:hypothetical protein
MDRQLMRELRRQQIIRTRLELAKLRNGLSLPPRVPVTYETLVEIQKQLEEHLATQLPAVGGLN